MPAVRLCMCPIQQTDAAHEDSWPERQGNLPLLHLPDAVLRPLNFGKTHAEMRGRQPDQRRHSASEANIPLADANSLLALSKTSANGSPNVNQTNQMVLNWLQALHVNANSNGTTNSAVKEEYIAVDDDDMEATEASELPRPLLNAFKKTNSCVGSQLNITKWLKVYFSSTLFFYAVYYFIIYPRLL
uniref:Uncharacterized protein n=1 Tax=Panagrolaimus sp. JU765 TaxID=591449 RepID=A0AC34RK84_9BILA